ncbi:NAD dependent epimerase/dehydratase family protein [Legionella massiliensis]|uniref:NAD dependent epimerase/dehydratase family protein n=1 Tax=Legionella massiliensis TaxID=1034943 RepID=A0A078KZ06_9GAMM|nr:NAD-dependent epimerase/dehydratase family protein [Legionella massiliensis]CDZ77004.1 NAD dependent epimerase/dehydratase family protein [Legionella massiliensis]CEE12742.1 NAD dependent epimerase/dehydratase family protein [Legionella massiliensis]
MHHLIIGYGYCGYHLAQTLLAQQQEVTAISRHLAQDMQLPGLNHLAQDISQPLNWSKANTVLHYLIPPIAEGNHDQLLEHFLAQSTLTLNKIVYYGSSAVYGNYHGDWVDEHSPCYLTNPRQERRLSAERLWLDFAKQRDISAVILRIAGIFGPKRLPIEAAKAQTPLIRPEEAPYTNHIYVRDLVNLAYQLARQDGAEGIYNLADGQPGLMGDLQQHVASALGLTKAPYETFQQAWERASPIKREFMQASKRLRINALETTLGQSFSITSFTKAIKESLEGS